VLPVVLQGGDDQVSALDFRLRYDSEVFSPESIVAGPSALRANKVVAANVAAPGEYVVVLMGLNQDTLSSGEIATISLRPVSASEHQGIESQIQIDDATLATWEGQELPSQGDQRSIMLGRKPEDPTEAPVTPPLDPDEAEDETDRQGEGFLPDFPFARAQARAAEEGTGSLAERIRIASREPDASESASDIAARLAEADRLRDTLGDPLPEVPGRDARDAEVAAPGTNTRDEGGDTALAAIAPTAQSTIEGGPDIAGTHGREGTASPAGGGNASYGLWILLAVATLAAGFGMLLIFRRKRLG